MICSICIDTIDSNLYVTDCEHKFHQECIETHVIYSNDQVKCPICRTILFKKTYDDNYNRDLDIINDSIIRLNNNEEELNSSYTIYYYICKYITLLSAVILYIYYLMTIKP